ncbi:hypothetical protein CBM2599_B50003 [Cupriavidus taiwanensis]|uniref:Uncharacterized protein n=1 Tax=Cupriavidus taiwanensis TaxID=164546 RepID=A0A375D5B9_9BURK|nr:hypothetical protein CBM2600_B10986 [Cupriavidus taiwanensis]SOY95982.1 hypothetical protein CBM2599_B50003 [Cupriavidus taiwanensis]SPD66535.1 protein of unknown function [Cupriavidus taiwanensis]
MSSRVLTPPESANGLAGHGIRVRLFSFAGCRVTVMTASRNTLRRDPTPLTQRPCAVLAGPPSSVREVVKTAVPTHFAPHRRLTMAKSKNNKNA